VSSDEAQFEDAAELFEDAPCGYLSTRPDGTIVRVNRTFESWTGYSRAELLGGRRFQDLLAPGARIYHETHYAPLLRMQGSVREIAVEIVRADGTRLPALVNSVLRTDDADQPRIIRTTVFDATDRRRYEQELLQSQRRERDIALRLQRSLLSGELPTDRRLMLDVAYQPGVGGLEVGGDWYDAFEVVDGTTLGLVVGDVVGRGIEAAATMGQLRSAVRALASTVQRPGNLLGALDGYARRHAVGRMATLIYAELDLPSGELRYSCAGHPPPLISVPGEEPQYLWEGRSQPLDSFGTSAAPRAEASYTLQPGSTLLLYTDGLVERRDRSIDDGMGELSAALARLGDRQDVAGAVSRELRDDRHDDDVCVVAAKLM
jgi:PAS domain S-box-containing protein